MDSNINNSIFEAYLKSKTPIVENKQESQQVIEEKSNAKPDFLDIDGDGNKKESMKKAASDKGHSGSKKKGMSAKQAKYFGKKKKKAVKESTTLNRNQIALRENFRTILQKNGLTDLVTPSILKSMYDAFNLGTAINETNKNFRNVKKEELGQLKKKATKLKDQGKKVPTDIEDRIRTLKGKFHEA